MRSRHNTFQKEQERQRRKEYEEMKSDTRLKGSNEAMKQKERRREKEGGEAAMK